MLPNNSLDCVSLYIISYLIYRDASYSEWLNRDGFTTDLAYLCSLDFQFNSFRDKFFLAIAVLFDISS